MHRVSHIYRPLPEIVEVDNSIRFMAAFAPAFVIALIASVFVAPVAQPDTYHAFHDARTIAGIPSFMNVVSNLPFAIIGLLGLHRLHAAGGGMNAGARTCFRIMFAAVLSTGAGSAWYHLAPDNQSLFWDRLPIAITAAALFCGFLAERFDAPARLAHFALAVTVAIAAASVLHWSVSGDLRFYIIVQFYPLIAIPAVIMLTASSRLPGAGWLLALGLYVAAKGAELFDEALSHSLFSLSGHTLKHLLAALALWVVWRMVRGMLRN